MASRKLDDALQWVIFILLLAILCFGPLATGAVRSQDFLIIQAATVLLVLLWAARCWLSDEARMLWPPVCWAVAAFVLYAVARYWTADIEYVARQELIRILTYGCIFFVALNNIPTRESVQWISLVLVLLAAGIAAYAIFQWASGSNHVWNFIRPAAYNGRGSGTYICPNNLAGFLELVLPLGLAYTLAGRGGTLFKLVVGYASLMILAGIAVTMSRAGWAVTIISLLLLFAVKIRDRKYRIPALALLALVAVATMALLNKTEFALRRIEKDIMTHNTGSGTIRLQVWGAAVRMWHDARWFGMGPGHFDRRFREYRPATVTVQGRPVHAHNDYLSTLADWGVVGLSIVGSAVVLLFAGVIRTWKYVQRGGGELVRRAEDRSNHQSNRAAFVSGASIGLVALLLHSFFDFNMQIPANAILAIAFMGFLTAHWRFATERWWCSRWLSRVYATIVALACVACLGGQGWRAANELHWLARANQAPVQSPERLPALEKAARAEPNNPDTAAEIGEIHRLESWAGDDDYREQAGVALKWFERASQLDPFDPYSMVRQGMCLVWLDQAVAAKPYFEKAEKLDPNGYFLLSLEGWYQFHLGNYAAAKAYFQRSVELTPHMAPNPVAYSYLELIERRLKEPPSLLNSR